MQAQSNVQSIFNCSLERAFKIPILGDATKFFPSYPFLPKLIGFIEDQTWGKAGGHRIPISSASLFSKKGPMFFDKILVREENKYWKWELSDFKSNMFFLQIKPKGSFFSNRKRITQ